MPTHLLALAAGFFLGFLVRGLVHRCRPASTEAVRLVVTAGPVTEQPTKE